MKSSRKLAEVLLALARYWEGLESLTTWNFKVNFPQPPCYVGSSFGGAQSSPWPLLSSSSHIISIISIVTTTTFIVTAAGCLHCCQLHGCMSCWYEQSHHLDFCSSSSSSLHHSASFRSSPLGLKCISLRWWNDIPYFGGSNRPGGSLRVLFFFWGGWWVSWIPILQDRNPQVLCQAGPRLRPPGSPGNDSYCGWSMRETNIDTENKWFPERCLQMVGLDLECKSSKMVTLSYNNWDDSPYPYMLENWRQFTASCILDTFSTWWSPLFTTNRYTVAKRLQTLYHSCSLTCVWFDVWLFSSSFPNDNNMNMIKTQSGPATFPRIGLREENHEPAIFHGT